MGLRVKDGGKSESPLVMRGIGVQTLPYPKGALTSNPGVSSRESLINYPQAGKQMTADLVSLVRPLPITVGGRKGVSCRGGEHKLAEPRLLNKSGV